MPIEFTYQAYFLPGEINVNSIFNNVVRIRSDSIDTNLFSGFEQATEALKKVRQEIEKEKGITSEQKTNFLVLMKSLANIAGQALLNNDYPNKISEDDFKKSLRQRLSNFSEIGSDLLSHPRAAGGETDLVFRKTVLELKVDDKKNLSLTNIEKYVNQDAAYTAGFDNRLGVLCVLDCSDKLENPTGTLNNDIGLIKVMPTSSVVTEPLPILVGLVVIRGNLTKPSIYSR